MVTVRGSEIDTVGRGRGALPAVVGFWWWVRVVVAASGGGEWGVRSFCWRGGAGGRGREVESPAGQVLAWLGVWGGGRV